MVKTRYKTAAMIAIVAGLLLLVSGIAGAGTWRSVKDGFEENVMELDPTMELVFNIVIALGALGGLLVIFAGMMLMKGLKRTARILITIGVGIGLIGLIIALLVAMHDGTTASFLSPSTGLIGIVLSIVARMMAK